MRVSDEDALTVLVAFRVPGRDGAVSRWFWAGRRGPVGEERQLLGAREIFAGAVVYVPFFPPRRAAVGRITGERFSPTCVE